MTSGALCLVTTMLGVAAGASLVVVVPLAWCSLRAVVLSGMATGRVLAGVLAVLLPAEGPEVGEVEEGNCWVEAKSCKAVSMEERWGMMALRAWPGQGGEALA